MRKDISETKKNIIKFRMEILKRFISPEVLNVSLDILSSYSNSYSKLSKRTLNSFKKSGFTKVGELLFLSDYDLFRIKGIGQNSLLEFFTEIERLSIVYKKREPTINQLKKNFYKNNQKELEDLGG